MKCEPKKIVAAVTTIAQSVIPKITGSALLANSGWKVKAVQILIAQIVRVVRGKPIDSELKKIIERGVALAALNKKRRK